MCEKKVCDAHHPYAETIARERFASGHDLYEIQTVLNVLEETIWTQIIRELPPSEYAAALGLVSAVLGAAKDASARQYVSLASQTKIQTLNLEAMFAGTERNTLGQILKSS